MSKKVDERVVSMEFDNKQFEANVKTSMSTIDKLKKSLNFDSASKGFNDLNKASKNFSLDSIAAGVESLQKRFSTFGIVGMRVIENITDSMIRLSSKTMSFLTEGIVQGGKRRAMNLENAHFQLQGLLKDEEAVAAVMQNVSDSVDGTAYSLDSAAKVASQLAASGMKAGDQMFSSLRAVAGVAAMTNSEYDEIGRIFTKVAGQGRLMGDDLLSLSSRGMNAAATLAEAMGTTESAVREMVSKGQIDFQTFASAMDNAFGEHAKKANETLTGALSNVKAALARIGALFVSPLVEQNGELVQLLNAVRVKINDIKTAMGPIADFTTNIIKNLATRLTEFVNKLNVKKPFEKISEMLTSSKWDVFIKKLNDAGISTDKFQEKLTEVAKKHGISVDDLIKKYGSLGKVMAAGKISKNIIIETLKKFVGVEKEASKATTDVTDKLEYFNKVIKQVVRGDFGNGEARIKAMTAASHDYAAVQKLVNYVWERNGKTWSNCSVSVEELTKVIGDMSTEELKSIGYTEEQAKKIRELAEEAEKTGTPLNELLSSLEKPTGKELVIDTFRNALKGLSTVISSVKKAWSEVFSSSKTSGALYGMIEAIHKLSEKFVFSEKRADKLKRTFKGLFAALDIVRMLVGGALNIAFKVLKAVLSAFNIDLLDVTATIGDAIVKFRDWLKEHDLLKQAIEFLAPIIKAIATTIKEAAVAVYEWAKNNETLQRIFKSISSWIDGASKSIQKWTQGLKETDNIPKYIISGLVNGLKNGIATVVSCMIELGKGILEAIKGVLGIHSPSTEFFEIGKNVIAGFVNGIKSGASTAWEALKQFGQKCIDIIKNIDFGAVLVTVFAGGILFTANKFVKALEMFASPFAKLGGMFSDIGSGVKTMCTDIGKYFKAKSFEQSSKAILNFAISIGILSASIFVLAKLAKNDSASMWEAFGMIAALATIMVGMAALTKKCGKDMPKIGATLLAIASAMAILAFAVKKLGSMSWSELGVAGAAMVGLGIIIGALLAITKKAGKNVDKVEKVFMKIARAMLVLAIAIKILGGMSWEQLGVAGAAMGGLTVIVAALIRITKNRKNIDKVQDVFMKIAKAMLLLAVTIKLLGTMSWESLGKAGAAMGGLLVIVSILVLITKKAGKNVDQVGNMLKKIAGAFLVLAIVAKLIAGMSWGSLGKAAVGMAGLLVVIGVLVAIVEKATKDAPKIGTTLAAIAGSIAILAMVAKVLGTMSWGSLGKAAVGMAGLVLVIDCLVQIVQRAGKDAPKIGKTLLAISGAIAILAIIAVLLGLVKIEHLAKGVIAIGILGVVMATLINAAKNAEKAIKPLIAMAAVVGILGGILYLLSTIDSEKVIASAAALVVAILSLSLALALISTSGGGASAGAALLLASVGLLAIAAAMAVLATIPADKIGQSLLLLAGALIALCGVAALFSMFAAGAGLMVGVLLSMAAVILAVSVAAVAFASALYIVGLALPLLADGLAKLITSLAGCSDSIGGFLLTMVAIAAALAIIAAPLIVISVAVIALAAALAVVSISAMVFAGALALMGLALPIIANGITALVNAIISCSGSAKEFLVTAAILAAGLTLLGAALIVAGAGVAVLGAGLAVVAVALIGISVSALIFAGALAIIALVLPLIANGITGLVTSVAACKDSMDNFKSVMSVLGITILEFLVKIAAGLVALGAGATVAGAGVLVLAAGIVVLSAAVLIGSVALLALAGAVYVLGTALGAVVPAFQGMAMVVATCCAAVNVALQGVASVINSVFSGIANVITSIGDSIRNVLDGISGVIDSIGNAALNAGKGFEKLANGVKTITDLNLIDMATSMGAVALAIGKITKHSEGLAAAGKGMQQIANSAKMSSGAFIAMAASATMATTRLSMIGSVASSAMSALKSSVAGTGACFVTLTASAASASASVAASISSMAAACSGAAKNMAGSFASVGRTLMTNMANGIRSGGAHVKSIMSSLLKALITTAKSRAGQFGTIGRTLATRFANGVKSGSAATKTAFSSALSGAVSNARSYYTSFYNAGSYVAQGFADGIKNNASKAETAAKNMAKAAAEAAAKALKINSPSKVFRAIAYSIPEGFAQGIDRRSWMAEDSAVSMAKTALNSTKNAISKVADAINSDIDTQPTIRPVVDLSDVTAGAGAINGLFTMQPSIGVLSRARSISSMMNENQNGDNSDVISAIKDLGHKIEGSSGNTYNVNGITYDDGTNVSNAIGELVRAVKIEGRT